MKIERLLDTYTDPDLDLFILVEDRLKAGVNLKLDEEISEYIFENLVEGKVSLVNSGLGGLFRHELKKEFIDKNSIYDIMPIILQRGDQVLYKKVSKDTIFIELVSREQLRPSIDLKKDYNSLLKNFKKNLDENIENLKDCERLRISPYIFKLYKSWGLLTPNSLKTFSDAEVSTSLLCKEDIKTIYNGFLKLKDKIEKDEFPTRNLKIIETLYIEELPFTISELESYINRLYKPAFERFSQDMIDLSY